MEFVSILNDVLGPVMHGPSSSHTAGSYRIGRLARDLFAGRPDSVIFTFDPGGSYAQVFQQQGVDLAFAAGILEWEITDERFFDALQEAKNTGLEIKFVISKLNLSSHPNDVLIHLAKKNGRELVISAKSTGGGGVLIDSISGWPTALNGKVHEVLIECGAGSVPEVRAKIKGFNPDFIEKSLQTIGNRTLLDFYGAEPLPKNITSALQEAKGVSQVWICRPVFFVQQNDPLFLDYKGMLNAAKNRSCSLGELMLEFEAHLLGMKKNEIMAEIQSRFEIMQAAVAAGSQEKNIRMQLLEPSAGKILGAESNGELAIGGLHTRAAAKAMAVMHVNNSMGIVCAAPTGGSAGTLPGVLVTLEQEKGLDKEHIALALLAASGIGFLVASQATFAAETAGCQVEIGAAGAMAAAAVVEAVGGTVRQTLDAAAISFQNTMGSVCDLVQGMCEIPCHTRNAVAASSAFVCADLILGGYCNPIPLDETIDAVYAVGKMLPSELRCTTRGGLAVTPAAQKLQRLTKK